MKTKEELKELSDAIGKAKRAYHKAVAENLKEVGRELNVIGWDDDEEEDEKGLNLTLRGDDNDLYDELIDKVRWNKEREIFEYHSCRYNYKKCDVWVDVSYMGDEVDYLFDAIDWDS